MKPRSSPALLVSSALVVGAVSLVAAQGCTIVVGSDAAATSDAGAESEVSQACRLCSFAPCTAQWATCVFDSDCNDEYACVEECGRDSTCQSRCFASHVDDAGVTRGAPEYDALTQCLASAVCNDCATTCAASLSLYGCGPDAGADAGNDASDAGTANDDGGDGAAVDSDAGAFDAATSPETCTACKNANCAAEQTACAAGTRCDTYADCLADCVANSPEAEFTACSDGCGAVYPDGKASLEALSTCVSTHCHAPCLGD